MAQMSGGGATGMGGAGKKTCVVCGEDCSNKPRTKDQQGRYYCRGCYDEVIELQRLHRLQQPSPPPLVEARARSQPTVSAGQGSQQARSLRGTGDAPGPSNMLEKLLESAPAAPVAKSFGCPHCGAPITPGVMLCVHCGFNTQTGQAVATTKVKRQREVTGGVIWPPVVGIVSIVLGGGGVLFYGAYLIIVVLAALGEGALGAALVTVIPIGTLLTALAAWLLRDGIRILRRDADGVRWIRFWAMSKLLIYGSCFVPVLAFMSTQALDEAAMTMPGFPQDLDVSDIKAAMLLVMMWFFAWPIFVMIFFFVPRIQNDVDAWG